MNAVIDHATASSADAHARLRRAFAQARQPPARRHRDIAELLGVSEGELIAAHATPFDAEESPLVAQRLKPAWPAIVEALEDLGEVTALTRNAACVHEKVGTYRHASVDGTVGLVLGGAIDLRVFYSAWAHGFAVQERTERGPQRSLQFFDAQGTAIHKVFLREASDLAAYEALVARFADTASAAPGIAVQPPATAKAETPDDAVDVAAFQAAWAACATPTSSSACCAAMASAAPRRCAWPHLSSCSRWTPARHRRCCHARRRPAPPSWSSWATPA